MSAQQTTIILSGDSVDRLFPEGTEARIQLANSAVKVLLRDCIKPSLMTDEINRIVSQHREAAMQDALKAAGITRGTWGSFNLSKELKEDLRTAADAAVRAAVRKSTEPAVQAAVERLTKTIESTIADRMRVELNRQAGAAAQKAIDVAFAALGVNREPAK